MNLHPGRASLAATCKWSQVDVLLFTSGDFGPVYVCTREGKRLGQMCRLLDIGNRSSNCVSLEPWEGPGAIFPVGDESTRNPNENR